jgi:hypothetical protein
MKIGGVQKFQHLLSYRQKVVSTTMSVKYDREYTRTSDDNLKSNI